MSTRTYRMGRRQAAVDETRERILSAARRILLSPEFSEFSMEVIARAARVSRLTVYYQFRSRAGLLEALYDYIARRGGLHRLPELFRRGNDPLQHLHEFIGVFIYFWSSEREVIRRLHGFSAIDSEVARGLHDRNERRRTGLRVILQRYGRSYQSLTPTQEPIAIDKLHMLTSFETYDALVDGRSREQVLEIICKMADEAIGFIRPVLRPEY